MMQFEKGIFITATDTEVGKTFVSGLLIRSLLQQGIRAGYFKPVASGCRRVKGGLVSEDLLSVEKFTGIKMEHGLHCPIRYRKPLAPMAAAIIEKRPVNLKKIWESFGLLKQRYSNLVVEGIGGIMVPLTENYVVLDLVAESQLSSVIVCRPALGTINHTLLTINALTSRHIPVAGFLTNGFVNEDDEAAASSPGIISGISGVPYLGHIPLYDFKKEDPDTFIEKKAFFLKQFSENLPRPANGRMAS